MTKVTRHVAGKKTQDFSVLIINTKKARRTFKVFVLKVEKKIMHMRPI